MEESKRKERKFSQNSHILTILWVCINKLGGNNVDDSTVG